MLSADHTQDEWKSRTHAVALAPAAIRHSPPTDLHGLPDERRGMLETDTRFVCLLSHGCLLRALPERGH